MNTSVLPAPATAPAPMSVFERYLSVWVLLCIGVGIAFGQMLPGPFQAIGRMEVAKVNLPVGLLIWVMIIPMLLKVDFAALSQVGQHWRGIGVTLFVNWAVKPFSMALLGWIFIRHVFAPYLPAGQADSYIAGLILLAAAPCTAMVFVWSGAIRPCRPCRPGSDSRPGRADRADRDEWPGSACRAHRHRHCSLMMIGSIAAQRASLPLAGNCSTSG